MTALPWAVHISAAVLTSPWLVGGYAVAGLLAFAGAWRVRDEEVPRVALLTAVFFIASWIHVPVPGGPRTHLLLTGLVGVLLGPRCLLAVPMALFLQAALLSHGGLDALGVNSCVMGLPALGSWLLFAGLRRLPWVRRPWLQAGFVAASVFAFGLSLVYAVALLIYNPPLSTGDLDFHGANQWLMDPVVLAAAALLAGLAAWWERRQGNAPEFPLGLLVGELAVLATVGLNALALLAGGREDFRFQVLITLVLHLPLAVVEGVVLGFTVGFLARVKPEMLGAVEPPSDAGDFIGEPVARNAAPADNRLPVALVLAALGLFGAPGRASAHRLEAEYKVLPDRRVRVESWFDLTNDVPKAAAVRVYRADGTLLTEGNTDADGAYTFSCDRPEPLRVVVNAGAGHQKELMIPEKALSGAPKDTNGIPKADPGPEREGSRPDRTDQHLKDAVTGVGFVLALAAFLMSLWNARRLRELSRAAGVTSPRERPLPAEPPTGRSPG
jgi:cobalt/nickel transport system permease protein